MLLREQVNSIDRCIEPLRVYVYVCACGRETAAIRVYPSLGWSFPRLRREKDRRRKQEDDRNERAERERKAQRRGP